MPNNMNGRFRHVERGDAFDSLPEYEEFPQRPHGARPAEMRSSAALDTRNALGDFFREALNFF